MFQRKNVLIAISVVAIITFKIVFNINEETRQERAKDLFNDNLDCNEHTMEKANILDSYLKRDRLCDYSYQATFHVLSNKVETFKTEVNESFSLIERTNIESLLKAKVADKEKVREEYLKRHGLE